MNITIKTYDTPGEWIGYIKADPFTIFFPADGGTPVLHNSRAIQQDENGNACAFTPSEWPETSRLLREAAGITQAQLAAALGFKSAATVSMWESQRREMNVGEIQAVAAALGYTVEMRLSSLG